MSRDKGITLSPKHGVNPSMGVCFLCGKDDGTIILPGRLKGDVEAPRRAVWSKVPCKECKGYMAQGVILISVRDGEDGGNPYRTGGWCVVKEDAVRRIFEGEAATRLVRERVGWVSDAVWDRVGLPRG